MPVQSLGYIGVDALELEAWRRFGTDVLAMQVIERDSARRCRSPAGSSTKSNSGRCRARIRES